MKTNIIYKIAFAILLAFPFFLSTLIAQNDTMYIMKNGVVVGVYDVNTEIDSIIFYRPSEYTPTFTDARDGNVYHMVTIGDQIWMAENLKYLPSVSSSDMGSYTTAYYYVYSYEGDNVAEAKATSYYTTYGVLYNWPAVMESSTTSSSNPSGIQGVCPTGWHLPSDAEWTELTDYLGGESVAGGKLKEMGTTHWSEPNTGATNESNFTALPGGCRDYGGGFSFYTGISYWWSATENTSNDAWCRFITCETAIVNRVATAKEKGLSVRCVKD